MRYYAFALLGVIAIGSAIPSSDSILQSADQLVPIASLAEDVCEDDGTQIAATTAALLEGLSG